MDSKNICFKKNGVCFNFRVSCIIKNENRVLLHKKSGDEFWNLIGGRVWLGESSTEAIRREIREELGTDCKINTLIKVCENFFIMNDTAYHEILMIFSVELTNDVCLEKMEEGLIFKWFDIADVESLSIKPDFTKTLLLGDEQESWWGINNEL